MLRGTGTETNRAPNKETEELTRSKARKLALANSQNASDFDNLRMRKISTSKRLQVRISMSPKQREEFASDITSLLVEKYLTTKTLQVH